MPLLRPALVALTAILAAAAPVRAATVEETLAKLATEAAKVGNVIWYESSPADQSAKIVEAFRKRFPALKLEHIRDTGGNTIGGRIVQEVQGGTRTADVATTGAAIIMPLAGRGMVKEHDWKSMGVSVELAPTPLGVVTAASVYAIIYNTQIIKEADAPKNWEDLADKRWAGKLGIWVRAEAQGGLSATWGVDKTADFIRRMNALNPVLLPSTFPLAQQVAAGELHVGLGLNHAAQPPLKRGAPIKVVLTDPTSVSTLYSVVPARAQNQAGGALLALWLATPEGAKAYEDATDRGNPYIPGTRTHTMLQGRKLTFYPPSQTADEAAAVQRFNKMLESREKP